MAGLVASMGKNEIIISRMLMAAKLIGADV
jgi:hypothetical protein